MTKLFFVGVHKFKCKLNLTICAIAHITTSQKKKFVCNVVTIFPVRTRNKGVVTHSTSRGDARGISLTRARCPYAICITSDHNFIHYVGLGCDWYVFIVIFIINYRIICILSYIIRAGGCFSYDHLTIEEVKLSFRDRNYACEAVSVT